MSVTRFLPKPVLDARRPSHELDVCSDGASGSVPPG